MHQVCPPDERRKALKQLSRDAVACVLPAIEHLVSGGESERPLAHLQAGRDPGSSGVCREYLDTHSRQPGERAIQSMDDMYRPSP